MKKKKKNPEELFPKTIYISYDKDYRSSTGPIVSFEFADTVSFLGEVEVGEYRLVKKAKAVNRSTLEPLGKKKP